MAEPMAKLRTFTMPKWGIEMTEGTIGQWMVEPGQSFKRGDFLASIETEKIANDVEAEYDGTVCRTYVRVGESVPIGHVLAVFATEPVTDAEVDAFARQLGLAVKPQAVPASIVADQTRVAAGAAAAAEDGAELTSDAAKSSPAARVRAHALGIDLKTVRGRGRGGRVTLQDVLLVSRGARPPAPVRPVDIQTPIELAYASPMATRLAAEHGLSLTGVEPTGPRGRIGKADVLAILRSRAAPTPFAVRAEEVTVRRMSSMRRAIAQQLVRSKTEIPHFYLRLSAQVDALLELRNSARREAGHAPSLNDYIVRAVALALHDVPEVNVQVHDDCIHRLPHADVAVAVATPGGLLTPIIFAAESKTVAQISAEIRSLAAAGRDGRLDAAQFKGGSFTVSNLGMHGIEEFDAIINPPQAAILAVGAARRQPMESANALSFATLLRLSMSCDHRVIDGAVGAIFLSRVKAYLEDPTAMTR